MADGTAEFTDFEHPLRTDDEDAQRQVARRIKKAMRTGNKRTNDFESWDGFILPRRTRYQRRPMGERPRLTQKDIGKALGLSQSMASKLLNNPGRLAAPQVFILRHELGVTLDWLRHGGENAYGRYEDDPQVIAMLYDRLSAYDKEHLCYMLMTLVGEDAEAQVYRARFDAYRKEWEQQHPKEAEAMAKTWQTTDAGLQRRLDEIANSIHGTSAHGLQSALDKIASELKPTSGLTLKTYLAGVTSDVERARQAADMLEAQGIDTGEMTADEVLALAGGMEIR